MKAPRLLLLTSTLVLGLAAAAHAGSVDQVTGTYNDEVPIDVPAFHAIAPSLRLGYGSGGGSGQLGVGWSLAGLSYLERVSNPGHGAPRYDSTDHWMLQGTELLPCSEVTAASSTSCNNGGTHTTRVETYTKIVQDGTGFIVWLKDGTKSEFRATQKTLGGSVFRYYLSQVTDTHGNGVSYGYTYQAAGSTTTTCRQKTSADCWPVCSNSSDINACMTQCTSEQICETTTDPLGGVVYDTYLGTITYNRTTITFTYEDRPDWSTQARGAGELVQTRRRLRTIEVRVLDGSGVSRLRNAYDLGYTVSGATRRSLLTSVTPYGSDATLSGGIITGGSRRPAMTFTYRGGANEGGDFVDEIWTVVGGGWGTDGYRYEGDFNGDGRTDLAYRGPGYEQHVKLATGSSTFQDKLFSSNCPGFGAPDWAWVGDFNGDGKSDYFTRSGVSMDWHESTGSAFVSHALSGSESSSYWATSSDVFIGDFDGDGKSDVASHVGGVIYVTRITGPTSYSRTTWSSAASGAFGARLVSWAGDVNGDGRADLITQVGGTIIVYRSTGSTFVKETWLTNGAAFSDKAYLNWIGDFNGDGKADLAAPVSGNLRVYLSTGSTFSLQYWYAYGASWPAVNDFRNYAMDADGDGKTDIVTYPGQFKVLRSLGTSFAAPDIWGGTGSYMGDADKTFPGDFNGDGRSDVAVASGTTIGVKRSVLYSGTTPLVGAVDLISSVNNGLGGKFTFTFVSSTQWNGGNAPPPFQTISAVTQDDGRGTVGTTDYVYTGAQFDRKERRFIGFGTVSEYRPRNGNGYQPLTVTTYDVTAADGVARPVKVERWAEGFVAEKTETTYAHSTTLPYRSLEVSTATTVKDVNAASRITTVSRAYDVYDGTWKPGFGNLTVETYTGAADVAGKARTIEYRYYPSTATWVTGKPALMTIHDGATITGTTLAQTLYYYDGAATWAQAPTRGDQTKEAAWLDKIWSGGAIVAANSYIVTQQTFDAYGNVTRTTLPATDAAPGGSSTTTVFDSTFHLYPVSVTNAKGHVVTSTWDVVRGLKLSQSANGLTTSFTYDALGRPTTQTFPTGTVASFKVVNDGSATAGYLESSAPGPTGGTLWNREYKDGMGRTWREMHSGPTAGSESCVDTVYDALGQKTKVSEPYICGGSARFTSMYYDTLGRPTQVTTPDGKSMTTSYTLGKTTIVDAGGHKIEREVDSLGHLTRQTEYLGATANVITNLYDPLGHKKQTTVGSLTTTWITDSLGRVLQETDPDRGVTRNEYDATSNPKVITNALGERTVFTYDVLGRILTKTTRSGLAGAKTTTSVYDEARAGYYNQGKLTSITDGDGDKITYDHGKGGQREKKVQTIGGVSYTQTWVYYPTGHLKASTFPDGDTLGTTAAPLGYDAAGRLNSIPSYLSSVTYDAAQRPTRLVFPNGTETATTYDQNRGWVTHLTTKLSSAGTVLHDLAYAYDGDGEVLNVTSAAAHAGETWTYAYDGLHRLTGATSTTGTAGTESYGYDGAGNLLSRTGIGSFTYAGHRVTRTTKSTGNYTDYSYDAAGRMTSRKTYVNSLLNSTINYTWNGDGLLEATAGSSFAYDAEQHRKRKIASGVTTLYLSDDYEITSGVVTKYISAGSIRIAKKVGATRTWLHADRQGSVQLETSQTGTVVARTAYGAYGQTIAGNVTGKAGYTGQELDETGLLYLHNRYYDPALGRFISPDPTNPSSRLVGLNHYAYAANNPVGFVDIDGHGWFDWVMTAVTVAVAVFAPELAPLLFAINTSINFIQTAESGGSMLRFLAATAIDFVAGRVGGQITSKGLRYAVDFGTGFVGGLVEGRSVGDAFRSAMIGTAISAGTDMLATAVHGSNGESAPVESAGTTGGDDPKGGGGPVVVLIEQLDEGVGGGASGPIGHDVEVPVYLGYDLGNVVVYIHYEVQGGKLLSASVTNVLLEGQSGVTSISGNTIKAHLMGPSDMSVRFEGDVGLMLTNSISVGVQNAYLSGGYSKSVTHSPIIALDGWVGVDGNGNVLYTSGWSRGARVFQPQMPAPTMPNFGSYFSNKVRPWHPYY